MNRSVRRSLTVFILLCTSAFIQHGISQTPKIIHLEFNSRKITGTDELRNLEQGEWYQLSIDGINTLAYQITLARQDTIIASKVSLPSFGTIDLSQVTSMIGGLTKLQTTSSEPGFREIKIDKTEKARHRINDEQSTIRRFQGNLQSIKESYDMQVLRVKEYALWAEVDDLCSVNYTFLKAQKPAIDCLIKSIDRLRSDIAEQRHSADSALAKYLPEIDELGDVISKNKEISKADQDIRAAYSSLATANVAAMDSIRADNEHALLASVIRVDNGTRTYTSLPFQMTGDKTTLKLSIIPRDNTSGRQSFSTEIAFPWSKNPSITLGSSFYLAGLYDDAFSTVAIVTHDSASRKDTVKSYRLVQEKPGRLEFGVAASVLCGVRICDALSLHVSLGPGVSINSKIRPRVLLGFGVSYGTKNKINITGGQILGFVDRESQAFSSADGVYPIKPDNVTVSRLDHQFFVSLGYSMAP
jgi:hypothetical protein